MLDRRDTKGQDVATLPRMDELISEIDLGVGANCFTTENLALLREGGTDTRTTQTPPKETMFRYYSIGEESKPK